MMREIWPLSLLDNQTGSRPMVVPPFGSVPISGIGMIGIFSGFTGFTAVLTSGGTAFVSCAWASRIGHTAPTSAAQRNRRKAVAQPMPDRVLQTATPPD